MDGIIIDGKTYETRKIESGWSIETQCGHCELRPRCHRLLPNKQFCNVFETSVYFVEKPVESTRMGICKTLVPGGQLIPVLHWDLPLSMGECVRVITSSYPEFSSIDEEPELVRFDLLDGLTVYLEK